MCNTHSDEDVAEREAEIGRRYPELADHVLALAEDAHRADRCHFFVENAETLSLELDLFLRDSPGGEEVPPEAAGHPDVLPEFFELDLGPAGLLALWGNIGRNGLLRDDKFADYLEGSRRLQKSLGLALADVTDPDRARTLTPEFQGALRELGTQTIHLKECELLGDDCQHGAVAYGWSIVTPLLRFGDFHTDFLAPIAADIIRFDQAHGGNWAVPDRPRPSYDLYALDAPTPIDALLEALSRNRAALEQVAAEVPDPRLTELLSQQG